MQKAIVKVCGGIGNQLFIYAFARLLSTDDSISVLLETRTGYTHDDYQRKYKLDKLNIKLRSCTLFETLFPYIQRRSPVLKRILFPNLHLYKENTDNTQSEILEIIKETSPYPSIFYSGYWHHTNFKKIRNILLEEFQICPNDSKFASYKKRIEEVKNSVCVHFRRVEYDQVLPISYYENAISYLENQIEDLTLFIFSDDIEWCRENIDTSHKCYFIENFEDELIELKLMTLCRNFIIANSTFSWWGAWLSVYENKIVCMPKGYTDTSMNGLIKHI